MSNRYGLSEREEDVLKYIMKHGANNRKTAAALNVSTHTIKAHICHIYDKLGVRDITLAVMKYLDFERASAELKYQLLCVLCGQEFVISCTEFDPLAVVCCRSHVLMKGGEHV